MFCCCSSTNKNYSEIKFITKTLGNIKNTHKAIQFVGLVELNTGKVITYHSSWDSSTVKEKSEKLLEKVVAFKVSSTKMSKEVGYDYSKESFIKGRNTILMTTEVDQALLVIYMEMNELKTEFFDCEAYLSTIDDFLVTLHNVFEEERNG
jgi:hypothetical protein